MGDNPLDANEQKPSLEDIEVAYTDLMQCYSACISNLVLRKWRFRDELVPTIVRWRTKKRIDMIRATLLLLIASIKKDETVSVTNLGKHCDDIEKFSSQISRSGYLTLVYNSIPAILLVLPLAIIKEIGIMISNDRLPAFVQEILSKLSDSHFINLIILLIILIMALYLVVMGRRQSSIIFDDLGVSEKDINFYDSIYRYSSIQNPSCRK